MLVVCNTKFTKLGVKLGENVNNRTETTAYSVEPDEPATDERMGITHTGATVSSTSQHAAFKQNPI